MTDVLDLLSSKWQKSTIPEYSLRQGIHCRGEEYTVQDQRRHRRMQVQMKVQLTHPDLGVIELMTKDVSEAGLYVLVDDCFDLPLGERVQVRTIKLGEDQKEVSEVLSMRIVRKDSDGIGLMLEFPF